MKTSKTETAPRASYECHPVETKKSLPNELQESILCSRRDLHALNGLIYSSG